jgi:hypothetical protein
MIHSSGTGILGNLPAVDEQTSIDTPHAYHGKSARANSNTSLAP